MDAMPTSEKTGTHLLNGYMLLERAATDECVAQQAVLRLT